MAAMAQATGDNDAMYLQRMGLDTPGTLGDRLNARLLRLGLARTLRAG
jgi:ribosomal protein S4